MYSETQNNKPDIHQLAEEYRRRVSMEMFGHDNASSAAVIDYGHEKQRKKDSMAMFGHENATMDEIVAYDQQMKISEKINNITAALLALRQFRKDKYDFKATLAVYESATTGIPPIITDYSDLVIPKYDLERFLVGMEFVASGFVRELRIGIHYRVNDDKLINTLADKLVQFKKVNNNCLPSFFQMIEGLVNGTYVPVEN